MQLEVLQRKSKEKKMKKQKTKSISELKKSATAIVTVKGLGLVCFNKKKSRGESVLLREPNHKLKITISSNKKDAEPLPNGIVIEIEEKENVTISIDGLGISDFIGYEKYLPTKTFDRKNKQGDENDFRWLVDFQDAKGLIPNGVTFNTVNKSAQIPLTDLFVKNALFFTDKKVFDDNKLQDDIYYVSDLKMPDSLDKIESIYKNEFGALAESLGCLINSSMVRIELTIGDQIQCIVLPKLKNDYYKIDVENVNKDESKMDPEPDMHYYYEVFSPVEPSQKLHLLPNSFLDQVKKSLSLTQTTSGVNGRTACHLGVLGDIDSFKS
jgi:hypothetical protein